MSSIPSDSFNIRHLLFQTVLMFLKKVYPYNFFTFYFFKWQHIVLITSSKVEYFSKYFNIQKLNLEQVAYEL